MKIDEMTWEDLCAFFAMQGMMAGNWKTDTIDFDSHAKHIAQAAYFFAEQMKEERHREEE